MIWVFFIFEEGFKDSLKNRMNLLKIVLNKSEKFLWFLILEVKKQELIELIVMFQVFRIAQKLV
ncbi:putative RNA helicase [Streptococcus pneumoniae]|nr:putative RNA helicase [Streptococcus pneumoniae]